MNTTDPINNNCDASEKSQQWYEKKYFTAADPELSPAVSPGKVAEEEVISKQALKQTSNDVILQHLLEITEERKSTTLVSQHYFHEALMETTNSSEQLDKARRAMENQKANDEGAAILAAQANSRQTADTGDQCEKTDVDQGQAHLSSTTGKAPPPSSTKTAKSSSSSSKRPSLLEGENLGADNKPPAIQAKASDLTNRKLSRTSPISFEEDSRDDIKVEVTCQGPAKSTGSPNKKLAAPQTEPTATATRTGAFIYEAINLCDDSDSDD
jgi:hypothetical protein